jgi:hypothetical protein
LYEVVSPLVVVVTVVAYFASHALPVFACYALLITTLDVVLVAVYAILSALYGDAVLVTVAGVALALRLLYPFYAVREASNLASAAATGVLVGLAARGAAANGGDYACGLALGVYVCLVSLFEYTRRHGQQQTLRWILLGLSSALRVASIAVEPAWASGAMDVAVIMGNLAWAVDPEYEGSRARAVLGGAALGLRAEAAAASGGSLGAMAAGLSAGALMLEFVAFLVRRDE